MLALNLIASITADANLLFSLGILQKMKEGAENVERKIQAKVESLKNANESEKGDFFFFLTNSNKRNYLLIDC